MRIPLQRHDDEGVEEEEEDFDYGHYTLITYHNQNIIRN